MWLTIGSEWVTYPTSHNGYSGFEHCMQRGIYDGTVIFLDVGSPPRTDQNFRLAVNENHHKMTTPLVQIEIAL